MRSEKLRQSLSKALCFLIAFATKLPAVPLANDDTFYLTNPITSPYG